MSIDSVKIGDGEFLSRSGMFTASYLNGLMKKDAENFWNLVAEGFVKGVKVEFRSVFNQDEYGVEEDWSSYLVDYEGNFICFFDGLWNKDRIVSVANLIG